MLERGSGILMHVSSLPGEMGIGDFGKTAYEFIDFLKSSNQKFWQILPLGPTGYGNSPYQSFSSFAGNPYFIDLEFLKEKGFLKEEDLSDLKKNNNPKFVDYGFIYLEKMRVLRKAYDNYCFLNKKLDMANFKKENCFWLEDYALYMVLKKKFDYKSWEDWPIEFKNKDIETIKQEKEKQKDEIEFYVFLQYLFYFQWEKLKSYSNLNGIKIIGDLPIFVALDSSDIWANSGIFLLDENRNPLKVSGCPPDFFSEKGQLWGNPLYDWDKMKKDKFAWWVSRIGHCFKLYDAVRLDHFRGFEAYWEIPANSEDAIGGSWKKGPGIELFREIYNSLGKRDIIAEDLGFISPEVKELLLKTGFPGMKVLLFAFDSKSDSDYLPHKYNENSIAYVGTHDNDTVVGWYENINIDDKNYCDKYFKKLNLIRSQEINWKFIEAAWSSNSVVSIVQMQDLIGLDNLARMNKPATNNGNWSWRLEKKFLTQELSQRLKEITTIYKR